MVDALDALDEVINSVIGNIDDQTYARMIQAVEKNPDGIMCLNRLGSWGNWSERIKYGWIFINFVWFLLNDSFNF